MQSLDITPIDLGTQLTPLLSTLAEFHRFLILTHIRPDGDAVGSVSGLAKSLRRAGKLVATGFADDPPSRFEFVLDEEKFLKPDESPMDIDAVLVLDAGDLSRTGFESILSSTNALVVNIDHHASNTMFGDINYVDPCASSTCEIVVDLLDKARLPLDADVAVGLYLGLLTDTRSFQNEGLRPAAHIAAAKLLETGLDTAPILSRLNCSKSLTEMKILGKGLEKLQLFCDGRLACIALDKQDMASCGAGFIHASSSGLWGQLTSIDGVMGGVGIVENNDGKVYCEFRSRGGLDVKSIAVSMGGGGHLAASGCNLAAPFDSVISEAMAKLKVALAEFDAAKAKKPETHILEACNE